MQYCLSGVEAGLGRYRTTIDEITVDRIDLATLVSVEY